MAVDARTPTIDMTAWRYNADDNVYHQIGIPYCAKPTDAALQTIAIFVPGAYFKGVASGDGTYVCTINKSGAVAGFRSENAPIAYPVDTPGYMSQRALTEYASFREFTDAGFVYAHVGRRGRNEGAPRGVVDLKAGVRFLRGNASALPCDVEKIFTFGMSGGGAQSALLGATRDAPEYAPYLAEIGAVEGVSDAVFGSMCWRPITSLETADAAYEYFMRITRSGLDEEE